MRAIEIVSDSLFSLSHCIFPVIMKLKEKNKSKKRRFSQEGNNGLLSTMSGKILCIM